MFETRKGGTIRVKQKQEKQEEKDLQQNLSGPMCQDWWSI